MTGLERIATALRDEDRDPHGGWSAEVDAFLTNGAGSRLYVQDRASARAEAERLAGAV